MDCTTLSIQAHILGGTFRSTENTKSNCQIDEYTQTNLYSTQDKNNIFCLIFIRAGQLFDCLVTPDIQGHR